MTEWEYIRLMNHNYLQILSRKQQPEEHYQYRMLTAGPIEGLLPCKFRHINGAVYLLYDISSRQSISSVYADKKMELPEVCNLFFALRQTIKNMESFLLPAVNLILRPEFVFQEPDTKEMYFICCPDSGEPVGKCFEQLYAFLLEVLDYEDEELTGYFYELYDRGEDGGNIYQAEEIYKSLDALQNTRRRKTELPEMHEPEADPMKENNLGSYSEFVPQKDRIPDQCKKVILFCLFYAAMTGGGVYYISLNYIFSFWENTLFYTVIAFVTLFMAGGIFCWFKKKESVEIPPVEEKEDSGILEENAAKELYGKTVYFEKAEIENKLYGIGKKNKRIIELTKFPYTIGKKEDAVDEVLQDHSVSRIHARFVSDGGKLFLEDLNSTNGTCKNGLMLAPHERVEVESEDEIWFGKQQFIFR